MDGQQTAHAVQREAPAQLDRREVGVDHRQQGVPRAAGDLGGDQTKGLQREVVKLELQDPAVFALGRVEGQEAAAAHASGIDGEPDAGRGLEAQVEIGDRQASAAVRERQGRTDPHAGDHRLDRPDRRGNGRGDGQGDRGVDHLQVDLDRYQGDACRGRTEGETDGQDHVGARAAAESEAFRAGPGHAKLEIQPGALRWQDGGEETVGVTGMDDERAGSGARREATVDTADAGVQVGGGLWRAKLEPAAGG